MIYSALQAYPMEELLFSLKVKKLPTSKWQGLYNQEKIIKNIKKYIPLLSPGINILCLLICVSNIWL